MNGKNYLSLITIIFITITPATLTAIAAQPCEVLPVESGSPYSYQFRKSLPRCEGMYRSPVAGVPGMTLVSLTFGKVSYEASRDQYLAIKLLVEPAEKTLIRAVGIPERLYYRLDVELGPGQSAFKLPLGDVIAPENILPLELGIYAVRKLSEGHNAFLPVYAEGSDSRLQGEVIAIVRPGTDVSDVQWRSYAPGIPPTAWTPVAGASGLVPEGTRLEIVIGKLVPPQSTFEVSYLSQGVGRADRFVLLAR